VKSHYPLRSILASNLRKIRLAQHITQERLAELAGLHRTYVGSVERGERNISIDNIGALAKALGVAPSVLLDGDKSE
jgi:transcriptional regulator with XRE-family HTH domain